MTNPRKPNTARATSSKEATMPLGRSCLWSAGQSRDISVSWHTCSCNQLQSAAMNNRLTDSDRLWQVLIFLIPREIISRGRVGWVGCSRSGRDESRLLWCIRGQKLNRIFGFLRRPVPKSGHGRVHFIWGVSAGRVVLASQADQDKGSRCNFSQTSCKLTHMVWVWITWSPGTLPKQCKIVEVQLRCVDLLSCAMLRRFGLMPLTYPWVVAGAPPDPDVWSSTTRMNRVDKSLS